MPEHGCQYFRGIALTRSEMEIKEQLNDNEFETYLRNSWNNWYNHTLNDTGSSTFIEEDDPVYVPKDREFSCISFCWSVPSSIVELFMYKNK
jgi:hypothetical protein